MTSDPPRPSVPGSIPDALSAVNRLHDDYWNLVRRVEKCINLRRFEQADLILSTLGSALGNAYHFRVQAARLLAARGHWPALIQLCRELLAIDANDPQALGLLVSAWAQMREFSSALALVASTPAVYLSAEWALETLFSALGHQDKTGLDLASAIRNAGAAEGRGELWEARMYRLAGEPETAAKILLPLTRRRGAGLAAQVELALTRVQMPSWHQHIGTFEAILKEPAILPAAAETLRRSVKLHALLKACYQRGGRGKADFHVPDSFFEIVFEHTRNPIYAPVSGRVALVGATMAAGGAERALGSAFAGLRASGAASAELWLYSRSPALQHDFFLKEMAIDSEHPDACFGLTFEQPGEPFSYLPPGTAHNAQAIHDMIALRRPEILHAWQDTTNLEAAFAGVLAGVPRIILHPHNMRPDLVHNAPVVGSLRRGYRALLDRGDVDIVFVSEASRHDYLIWLGHEGHERCHVVYNGFDCPPELSPSALRARRTAIRRELGIPPEAKVVGGVFRFHKVKRPQLWLNVAKAALRQDPGLIFAIFGDGPELEGAKEHARRLGIDRQVRFPGKVKAADEKVVAFDVLLHTSETEGLPTVLIEAQVAGVPVVAYGTGGVPECLHPAFSEVCRSDSADELSKALLGMLERRPRGKAVRDAARVLRERFSRRAMVKHLERIYGL